MNRRTVGVAPGTTTFALGPIEPSKRLMITNPWIGQMSLGEIPKAKLRWDLILLVGGGALVAALAAGLIASALED